MQEMYGMKEFYDVTIRANQPIEIGGKKFDINEALLSFSTAEIASIDQSISSVQARGGYHNPALINWDNDREVRFGISHGVLSPVSWALLSNSQLISKRKVSVPYKEVVDVIEDDEYCFADLRYCPNACLELMGVQPNPCFEPLPMGRRPELMLKPLPPSKTKFIFCYDEETGEKIRDFEIYRNRIYFKRECRHVVVDYTFDYENEAMSLELGKRLCNGYLSLDGKMNIKGDIKGEVTTVVLKIPKIKITSALSLRLGKQVDDPVVSDFYFTGYFDENVRRDSQKIWELTFLKDGVDSEYES